MFAVSFIAICLMIDTDDVEVCPETKTYTLAVSGAFIDWRRLFIITEIRQHLTFPSWCLWNNLGTSEPTDIKHIC